MIEEHIVDGDYVVVHGKNSAEKRRDGHCPW
jgi:SOS-response transcriptional repressor LexA